MEKVVISIILSLYKAGSNAETIINAGLISYHRDSSAEVATFHFAVDRLRKEKILPEEVQIRMFNKVTCDQFKSPGYAAELMQEHNLTVIFGPGCSKGMISVATLAVFWNIPVLGYVSTAEYLADKTTYKTLTRLSATTTQDAGALVAFLDGMGWRKVAYVIRRTDLGSETMASAVKKILDDSEEIDVVKKHEIMDRNPSPKLLNRILRDLKTKARIIVVAVQETSVKGNITRNFMLEAHKLNMTGGEFVFIAPWALRRNNTMNLPWNYTDENDAAARLAFRQVLVPMAMGTDHWAMNRFIPKLIAWGLQNSYENLTSDPNVSYGPIWLAFLFDSVYIYGKTVASCLKWNSQLNRKECDIRNGTQMFNAFRNIEIKVNLSGSTIRMDDRAERVFDFVVVGMDPEEEFSFSTRYFELSPLLLQPNRSSTSPNYAFKCSAVREFPWLNGEKPEDTPVCGMDGKQCSKFTTELILVCTAAGLIVSFCFFIAYKKKMHMIESDALAMNWCIERNKLIYFGGFRTTESTLSLLGSLKAETVESDSDSVSSEEKVAIPLKASSLKGSYREKPVIIKTYIKRDDTNPWSSREILHQVKALWELQHPNLNSILGLSRDQNKTQLLVLWGYESKGSLQDVLSNEEIDLSMFKASFAADIVQGIDYLHNSKIGVHGNLTAANCIIDNRWMIKLTDFGLRSVLSEFFQRNQILWKTPSRLKLLHLPPEALQDFDLNCPSGPPSSQTQKADIYALGIILYQIWFRSNWNSTTTTGSSATGGKESLKNDCEFVNNSSTRDPTGMRYSSFESSGAERLDGISRIRRNDILNGLP